MLALPVSDYLIAEQREGHGLVEIGVRIEISRGKPDVEDASLSGGGMEIKEGAPCRRPGCVGEAGSEVGSLLRRCQRWPYESV